MNYDESFTDPAFAPDGAKFRSLSHPGLTLERYSGGLAGHEYVLSIDGQPVVAPRVRTTHQIRHLAPFRLEAQ